jgi:hypothetical protein
VLAPAVPLDRISLVSEFAVMGMAISPRGDMPKYRVRFSSKDAACPLLKSHPIQLFPALHVPTLMALGAGGDPPSPVGVISMRSLLSVT